jgi:hypothetical protein
MVPEEEGDFPVRQWTWDLMILSRRLDNRVAEDVFSSVHGDALSRFGHDNWYSTSEGTSSLTISPSGFAPESSKMSSKGTHY